MKPTLESQLAEVDTGIYELTITITTDVSKWTSLPARIFAPDWGQARIQAAHQIITLRAAFGMQDKPVTTCTGCALPGVDDCPLVMHHGQLWHDHCYRTLEV
jgi:hypothetical protein